MDQPETDDEGGRILTYRSNNGQMHLLVRAGEPSDSERDMKNGRWITKRDWQVLTADDSWSSRREFALAKVVPSFEKFGAIFRITARKRTIPVVTSRAHLKVDMYYETITNKHFEALNRCECIREVDDGVVMEHIGARFQLEVAPWHARIMRHDDAGCTEPYGKQTSSERYRVIKFDRLTSAMSKFRVHYSQALNITLYSRD
ncbi:uncharacterized protein F5147DRAFT_650739 [Suillus discolor]|uniref:Uncharacterized protein n=1 Tax=Suillus discolor TaxID=1912936 RepID=A0A9P7FCE0_9AGAM|nr:uncharacterized protein F5147DRAFT_650739 [Suillus discolor]KAG2112554.1 hypothetical protein F5147DRAFT_650739 [Suillus discolor]